MVVPLADQPPFQPSRRGAPFSGLGRITLRYSARGRGLAEGSVGDDEVGGTWVVAVELRTGYGGEDPRQAARVVFIVEDAREMLQDLARQRERERVRGRASVCVCVCARALVYVFVCVCVHLSLLLSIYLSRAL